MKAKRLAIDAMMAAMCAALGYVSLDFGGVFKFSFENLPVIVGALLFGPVDGMIIGAVGTFLYQVLKWGVDATTALWVLPYVVSGLLVGLFAKWKKFRMNWKDVAVIVIIDAVLITLMNTGVLVLDSKIKMYPTPAVLATLPGKLLVDVLKTVAYAAIVPVLIQALRKAHLYEAPGAETADEIAAEPTEEKW